MAQTYALGRKEDSYDDRDLLYEPDVELLLRAPVKVDLTGWCCDRYDQGDLGSCTAQAASALFRFLLKRQKLPDFLPSRLYLYYCERMMERTTAQDSGATVRESVKVLAKGVCAESEWPYDIRQFAVMPPARCFVDAKADRALKYQRIQQDVAHMKACLANGFPFLFGIDVFQSFMDATDGNIPMPGPDEQTIGGHALLCVGYDDASQRFTFQNSWGANWGQNGFGTIPYQYLASQDGSDFWEVELVQEAPIPAQVGLFAQLAMQAQALVRRVFAA